MFHSDSILSRSEASLPPSHRSFTLHSPSVCTTSYPANPQLLGKGAWQGVELQHKQDYLSPSKLQELSGHEDLSEVTYLELQVNTTENSLGNFGRYLPTLQRLRLVSSLVPCVRDLGTTLECLTILWMARCHLRDLDGLTALSHLQELYVAYNDLSDISLVAMLSSLEVLDIEGNCVSEDDQLGYLCLCASLTTLTLDGNPLSHTLTDRKGGEGSYRMAVHEAIPQLKTLDDIPLNGHTHSTLKSESSVFQLKEAGMGDDLKMVQERVREGRREEEEEQKNDDLLKSIRPKTAPLIQGLGRPLLTSPPMEDDSSELTHGLSQVICGNPVRALKARKKHGLTSQSSVLSPPSAHLLTADLKSWSLHPSLPVDSFTLSLEDENITITKARSEENLNCAPGDEAISIQQPAHLLVPTPPHLPSRPKSVSDFRHRRYRRAQERERLFPAQPHPPTHSPTQGDIKQELY